MKVVLLDHGRYSGGIEVFAVNLVRELAARVEVLWVVPAFKRDQLQAQLPASGSLQYALDYWDTAGWRKWTAALLARLGRLTGQGPWAERLCRQWRYRWLLREHEATHIVYPCHLEFEPVPGRLPSALVVYDLHWHAFPEAWSKPAAELDRELRDWMEACQTVFTISKFSATELRRLDPAVDAKLVTLSLAAPPGIQQALPSTPPATDQPPVFYYPSSVGGHKNHRVLLEAVLRLAQEGCRFHVTLSGGGTDAIFSDQPTQNRWVLDCRAFYKQHETLLADYFTGTGHVPEVEPLYANAHAILLPSAYEGFGLPLVEGLARGLPVLGSDIPPFREQVEFFGVPERVRLFPPSNAQALAAAMKAFLEDFRLAKPQALASDRPLRRWTWGDVAEQVLDGLTHGGWTKGASR